MIINENQFSSAPNVLNTSKFKKNKKTTTPQQCEQVRIILINYQTFAIFYSSKGINPFWNPFS